jgi:hypothetical protein
MRDLVLEQKTGFSSMLPFVIYEPNGQVFYSSDFTEKIKNGLRLNFNLPEGVYRYDGQFTKLDEPVSVVNIPLPMYERFYGKKRYDIIFGTNPNKCTIFYDKGVILFDNSIMSKPLYVKYGIYYHELGHHFYKTEKYADLYSAKRMLEKGFNPSQVGRAFLDSLSEKSIQRKMDMVNTLTKNEG